MFSPKILGPLTEEFLLQKEHLGLGCCHRSRIHTLRQPLTTWLIEAHRIVRPLLSHFWSQSESRIEFASNSCCSGSSWIDGKHTFFVYEASFSSWEIRSWKSRRKLWGILCYLQHLDPVRTSCAGIEPSHTRSSNFSYQHGRSPSTSYCRTAARLQPAFLFHLTSKILRVCRDKW